MPTMQTARKSTGGVPPCNKTVVVEVPTPAGLVKRDIFSFEANSGYNMTWKIYQCTVPETEDGIPPSIIRINIPTTGNFTSIGKVEVKNVKVVKKHCATPQEARSVIEPMTPAQCKGPFSTMYQETASEAEKFRRHVEQVRSSVLHGAPPLPPRRPTPPSAASESLGIRHELLSLRAMNQSLQNTVNDLRESNEALAEKSSMDATTIKQLKGSRDRLQKSWTGALEALAAKEREMRDLGQKLAEKERQLATCDTDSASLKRSMSSLCSTEGNKKRMRAFLHPDKLPNEDQVVAKTVRDILQL